MAQISATPETFARYIRVATADFEPVALSRELARVARESLAEAIRSGEGSENYDIYVNGRKGASEDSVTPPGPIVYVFVQWPTIIKTALDELRKRAPVLTGLYADSFVVLANQKRVSNYETIPADAEVVILNVQPYTRKLEAGETLSEKKQKRRSSGHFSRAKSALNRTFAEVCTVEMTFLNVAAGIHAGVPYILKGQLRRAKQNQRSSAFRAGRAHLAVRKDRLPGMPITYPALIFNLDR